MEPWQCVAAVMFTPVLYFALGFGLHLFGGLVDQPHPIYIQGTWFTRRVSGSVECGAVLAVLMAILVGLDVIAQRARGACRADLAYYPTAGGLGRCLSVMPARLLLLAGILVLVGYLVGTELDLRTVAFGAGGLVWPSERVVAAGLVLWGVLWLADCLARPGGGTRVAAVGFLVLALLCLPITYGH